MKTCPSCGKNMKFWRFVLWSRKCKSCGAAQPTPIVIKIGLAFYLGLYAYLTQLEFKVIGSAWSLAFLVVGLIAIYGILFFIDNKKPKI